MLGCTVGWEISSTQSTCDKLKNELKADNLTEAKIDQLLRRLWHSEFLLAIARGYHARTPAQDRHQGGDCVRPCDSANSECRDPHEEESASHTTWSTATPDVRFRTDSSAERF